MRKTAYIYKLKAKYVKNYKAVLALYPCLSLYEGEDERMIAMPFRLPEKSLLSQGLVKQIEFLYEKGTSKEREEWEKNGMTFTEVLNPDQSTHFVLNMNEEILNEITEAQLCMSLSDIDKGCLFINAPNKIAYYNIGIYEDSGLGDLIKSLLDNKIIYRKKVRYGDA